MYYYYIFVFRFPINTSLQYCYSVRYYGFLLFKITITSSIAINLSDLLFNIACVDVCVHTRTRDDVSYVMGHCVYVVARAANKQALTSYSPQFDSVNTWTSTELPRK